MLSTPRSPTSRRHRPRSRAPASRRPTASSTSSSASPTRTAASRLASPSPSSSPPRRRLPTRSSPSAAPSRVERERERAVVAVGGQGVAGARGHGLHAARLRRLPRPHQVRPQRRHEPDRFLRLPRPRRPGPPRTHRLPSREKGAAPGDSSAPRILCSSWLHRVSDQRVINLDAIASHRSENGSISTVSSIESEKAAYEFLAQTPIKSTDAHLVEFSEAMRTVAKALRRVAEGKATAQAEAAEWKRKYELEMTHKQQIKIKGSVHGKSRCLHTLMVKVEMAINDSESESQTVQEKSRKKMRISIAPTREAAAKPNSQAVVM